MDGDVGDSNNSDEADYCGVVNINDDDDYTNCGYEKGIDDCGGWMIKMLVVEMVLMMMVLVFMVVVILILGMIRPKTVSETIELMMIAIVMMMVALMTLVMLILQSWKKKLQNFFTTKFVHYMQKETRLLAPNEE